MLAIFSGALHLSSSKHFIHINHQLEQLRGWSWEEGSNNHLIGTKVTERDSEPPIPPTHQTTQVVESRKEITESPVSFPAFPPSFSGTHMKDGGCSDSASATPEGYAHSASPGSVTTYSALLLSPQGQEQT